MVRFLSAFFILLTLSFGVDINSIEDLSKFAPQSEASEKGANNQRIGIKLSQEEFKQKQTLDLDDLSMIAPTDEPELMLSDERVYQNVRPTKLSLKTSNTPKSAYTNQIFKIDFRADMGQDIAVDTNISIDKNSDLKWLNENSLTWIRGDGVFETTLWFEALSGEAKLDKITMVLNRNGEFFQQESITPKMPTFKAFGNRENFANLTADKLEVKSYKTSKFDDNSNIMTIGLAVKNANLSSFTIDNKGIIKQGVDSVKGGFDNQKGFYFAVIDNNMTQLNFSYFNLQTKKFENFVLDIKVEEDDLSTQIGLNPKESKFEEYKQIAIYAFAGLLLVMFVASKNITPLIFAGIILVANFLLQNPYGSAKIAKGVPVRILPIAKSTIFYVTKDAERVDIFAKNGEFVKIMLSDGKIGWVGSSDIRKD